ncbi:hypothetical protein ACF0H5_009722 [Mactra antiquata]
MGIQELVVLTITLCSIHKTIAENINGDSVVVKRTPGWGKRNVVPRSGFFESVLSDLSRYELNGANEDSLNLDLDKRRPGWGKRSFTDDFELDKRKPGWGKRSYGIALNDLEGTEKRTPGWGKRSLESNLQDELTDDEERIKRRPGWGKRSEIQEYDVSKRRPGWGKRTPGWGKRSSSGADSCHRLINDIRILRAKLDLLSYELPDTCPSLFEDDEDMARS